MVFNLLCPELRHAIELRGWEQATPTQQLSIPKVLEGRNLLLIAPVSSGKTEGVMLPVLHFIKTRQYKPISTLYITPLKALNRDLLQRLLWWCEQLGIDACVRHGDTSAYERRKQVQFPTQLFIITLEQLQPMLVGKRLRELLSNVRHVILDEVHEYVDSKRGIQVAVALQRLRQVCGDFQLLMLSATIGNAELVSNFFGKQVEVLRVEFPKPFELKVVYPLPKPRHRRIAEQLWCSHAMAARLEYAMEFIRSHEAILTFTNTRDFAEVLASRMWALEPEFPIRVHHSSLSKEVRQEAEQHFKCGKIKSIVCTSSLELGIDVGRVEATLQYQSPRQVAQLIQRVGRSGHALHRIAKGVIIATDPDDAFEAAAIAKLALEGWIERPRFHSNSLDVLAHQLLGLAIERGRVDLQQAYKLITQAWPYQGLSYAEFLEVCKFLESLRLVWLDGSLRASRKGVEHYFDQISTIPSVKQYKVFNVVDRCFIGVLDEEFVTLHAQPGVSFIVKGEAWKVLDVSKDKVLVEPTVDLSAAVPGWEGELIPVPYEVAQAVGKLRRWIAERIDREDLLAELQGNYPVDEACARKLVQLVKQQLEYGLPNEATVQIEHEGKVVVIHACFGTLVNETFGKLLSFLLSCEYGQVVVRTDPYRIILEWPSANAEIVKEILLNTEPELLRSYVELSLARSELFEWKFVVVAKRFGVLAPDATLSRFRLQRLIQELVGTPVYKEALKEVETEKLDVELATQLLRRLQSGQLRLVVRKGLSPLSKLGVEAYGEIVIRPEAELLQSFKQRLLNSKVKLACLHCAGWERVYLVKELPPSVACKHCGAKLLAAVKPEQKVLHLARQRLRGKLKEDVKQWKLLLRSAELYLTYGSKLALCLAALGVGPESAARILAKRVEGDELFKELMNAERRWLLTRRYWKAE